MFNFTEHSHPTLAVPCPDCRAASGTWCRRPCGHRAAELHMARTAAAFRAFRDSYGPSAEIRQDPDTERWEIEGAETRVEARP